MTSRSLYFLVVTTLASCLAAEPAHAIWVEGGNYNYTGSTTTTSGTLRVAPSSTISAPNFNSTFVVGNSGTFIDNAIAAAATVNFNGGLTKSGAGTLTLSAGNPYVGSTIDNAGTLTMAGPVSLSGAAASLSTINTLNLGTLNSRLINGSITMSNYWNGNDYGGVTVSSITSGAANFSLPPSSFTYSGATTTSGGTLRVSGGGLILNGGALNGGILNVSGAGHIGGSATFTTSSSATWTSGVPVSNVLNFNGGSTPITVTFGGSLLARNGNSSSAPMGPFPSTVQSSTGSITSGLTKTGVGTLTLSGANSYTGTLVINPGSLAAGSWVTVGKGTGMGVADFSGATNASTITLLPSSTGVSLATVPEPSGVVLGGLALAALFAARRFRR